ncbi:MAG: hypothetical protein L0287_33315 [Anaerolineae bacterium]|nr:hypothetical protein [Anaerolineae bacterium]
MSDPWILSEDSFDPKKQHHKETVFTIGNGYLCTRGASPLVLAWKCRM